MSSSHSQSSAAAPRPSLSISCDISTSQPAAGLLGGYDDEAIIRRIVTGAIKASEKSRQQIAEQMTILTGQQVTQRALDSYTSESAKQNRFPAQYIRAFCQVTGDWELLDCVVEGSGLHLVTEAELQILEYGRQMLLQERAGDKAATLKARLAGLAL